MKIVIWKDGTYKFVPDGVTYEFENDENWLTTIDLSVLIREVAAAGYDAGFKRGFDQVNVNTPDGNIYPDKETYLNSLTSK